MPILSPRPPSPRHRGVCVQRSQPPGKDTACAWLSQRGFGRRGWGDPWTAERVPRSGYGSHGNPSLLSQRSRSVLRERWLRCSDTVRGFRPGHVPLWVPDITARFHEGCSRRVDLPPRGCGTGRRLLGVATAIGRRVQASVCTGPGLCRTSENAQKAKFAEFLFHALG